MPANEFSERGFIARGNEARQQLAVRSRLRTSRRNAAELSHEPGELRGRHTVEVHRRKETSQPVYPRERDGASEKMESRGHTPCAVAATTATAHGMCLRLCYGTRSVPATLPPVDPAQDHVDGELALV